MSSLAPSWRWQELDPSPFLTSPSCAVSRALLPLQTSRRSGRVKTESFYCSSSWDQGGKEAARDLLWFVGTCGCGRQVRSKGLGSLG